MRAVGREKITILQTASFPIFFSLACTTSEKQEHCRYLQNSYFFPLCGHLSCLPKCVIIHVEFAKMKNPYDENPHDGKKGLLLLGSALLASGVSAGCANFENACGVPEISNQTVSTSTLSIKEKIEAAVEHGESVYQTLTCPVDSMVALSDREFAERTKNSNDAAASYDTVDTVYIPEDTFGFQQNLFDRAVFHEFTHGQADYGEMGWPEWKDDFADINYHGIYQGESVSGVDLDDQCVSFYACAGPEEHYAETISTWGISPLTFLGEEGLTRSVNRAKVQTGDMLVPAYSQIETTRGFYNANGEDNGFSDLILTESGLLKLIAYTYNGGFRLSLEAEGGEVQEYSFDMEEGWDLNLFSFSESDRGIYMVASKDYDLKLIELDLVSGQFSEIVSWKVGAIGGINKTAVYDNKVWMVPWGFPDGQVVIQYFDVGKNMMGEMETKLKLQSGLFGFSNVNSDGHMVVHDGYCFYVLDLNTGEVLSKTYDLGGEVDSSNIILLDSGEFYAIADMDSGKKVLLEGAQGDVRMRMAELDNDKFIDDDPGASIVIGDRASFGFWDSEDGTTFLNVSLPQD